MTDFRNLYVKGPDFQLLASGELSVWSAVFLGRDNLLMYYQRAPFEDRHSILQGFLVINCNEAKKDFFNEGQKNCFFCNRIFIDIQVKSKNIKTIISLNILIYLPV
jgi:hypothetical protein